MLFAKKVTAETAGNSLQGRQCDWRIFQCVLRWRLYYILLRPVQIGRLYYGFDLELKDSTKMLNHFYLCGSIHGNLVCP